MILCILFKSLPIITTKRREIGSLITQARDVIDTQKKENLNNFRFNLNIGKQTILKKVVLISK